MLIATALVWSGDAEGYDRIEQAAILAGTRRTPEADLARMAAEVIRTGGEPRALRHHFEVWPDDLLARLLLPRLAGFDADLRLELATYTIALDPGLGRRPGLAGATTSSIGASCSRRRSRSTRRGRGSPVIPRLVASRARSLLLEGNPAEARRVVEEVAPSLWNPELVAQHAASLRMLRDLDALDAVDRRISAVAEPARRVAYARGRAEAAFGLGNIEEANVWLTEGFELASVTGRFDEAVELARLQQVAALLLGRPDDLALALERAQAATLLGVPQVIQDRLRPRVLLLQGLSALEAGDTDHVQQLIQLLEAADRGERQAAVLRAASMAKQGLPVAVTDDPTIGCVGRSLDARWQLTGGGDAEASFAALLAGGSRCSSFGVERYVRADAEMRLAEFAIGRGDTDQARVHVDAFHGWMPDPDLGTPLYDRLARQRTRWWCGPSDLSGYQAPFWRAPVSRCGILPDQQCRPR